MFTFLISLSNPADRSQSRYPEDGPELSGDKYLSPVKEELKEALNIPYPALRLAFA
jgi:hypothetical protein